MKFRKRITSVATLLLISLVVFAKDLRRIIRAIEKGDLEKTMELIEESLLEQPVNPGAKYYLARHLTYDSLPFFDIDSARLVIDEALVDYENATYKDLEELSRNSLGLVDIQALSGEIEGLHWRRCLDSMQIDYFELFLSQYPISDYVLLAREKRDSLYWDDIRSNYDLQEYAGFLETFGSSHLQSEVRSAYDSLLYFSSITRDRLVDYENFLKRYPDTPFRERAEWQIFRRSTASNDPAAFREFLENYRTPWLRKRAGDILYYLEGDAANHPLKDSLAELSAAVQGGLVPVYRPGVGYTLVNAAGDSLGTRRFGKVMSEYRCGAWDADVFFVKDRQWEVINRLGEVIYRSDLNEMEELGSGLLYLRGDESGIILHKSGYILDEEVEEAKIVGDRWLRVMKDGRYGLLSFSGYPVSKFRYNQIHKTGAFWVFEEDGDIAVYNTERMLDQLHDEVFDLDFRFDDYEIAQDSLLIGFRRGRECLMDHDLRFLIPWGEYEIFPSVPFHYTRADSVYQLYGDFRINGRYARTRRLIESESWIAFKGDSSQWSAINKIQSRLISSTADSVYLVGDHACILEVAGDRTLMLPNDSTLNLETGDEVSALRQVPGTLSAPFFMVTTGPEKKVYDKTGQDLFGGSFDSVIPLNDSLFVVERRNKTGVVNLEGERLIGLSYDLVREQDGLVFLLRSGKIGSYLLDSGTYITTKYEARLERHGDQLFRTRLQGKFGLIDREETVVLPFDYDDIRYWSDSLVWVQNEAMWSLRRLHTDEVLIENVFRFSEVVNAPGARFAKFYGEYGYGLIDDLGNMALSPKFNEIINLGSDDDPIFQVELYSPEAAYYLVFYMNKEGERLAAEAYTPQEYERVLCED